MSAQLTLMHDEYDQQFKDWDNKLQLNNLFPVATANPTAPVLTTTNAPVSRSQDPTGPIWARRVIAM